MNSRELWTHYKAWLYDDPATGFRLDVSRMALAPDHDQAMGPAFATVASSGSGAAAQALSFEVAVGLAAGTRS